MILASNYNTPVPYWLGLSLPKLREFIREDTLLRKEQKEYYDRLREEARNGQAT